jgi:manganese/zinc/iron transport system permease protein
MLAAIAPTRTAGSLADVTDELPSLADVVDVLTLRAGFNTTTVILGTTLLGVAAGLVGVFALLRKRSLTTDALSHATLPGIVLAFVVSAALGGSGRSLAVLLAGAAATGVLGVLCIQAILRHTRLREDAAIGIVLSVFFGAGVVGLSYVQANAATGAAGLSKFIYGQTAAMRVQDAAMMGGIALVAALAALLLLKEFAIVCFNDAFARVVGWRVGLIDLVMMSLVVLVTVAGLQAVGLILVVAMLIVPAVSARFWTDRLWLLVLLAAVIGGLSGYLGSVASALMPRKPAGAVIVLVSGALFAVSFVCAPARGVVASGLRRARLRIRIACDHVLEAGAQDIARDWGVARGWVADEGSITMTHAQVDALARLRGWPGWLRAIVLWTLARRGLVRRVEGGLALSPAGLARGRRVSRNHRLWTQYLVSHADIAPSHVDWSVDQVEHVLSDELIAQLEAQLAGADASGRAVGNGGGA